VPPEEKEKKRFVIADGLYNFSILLDRSIAFGGDRRMVRGGEKERKKGERQFITHHGEEREKTTRSISK